MLFVPTAISFGFHECVRGDAKWHKVLVTKYKTQVVFPALCSRDDAESQRAACKSLLGLGVTYHDLVPQRSSQGWDWLFPLLNVEGWKLVKSVGFHTVHW